MTYKVKVKPTYGRGCFAVRPLKQGSIILECEIIEMSAKETLIIRNTKLNFYDFKVSRNRTCVVIGDGSCMNHRDPPNTSYKLVKRGSRFIMRYRALVDIEIGEQLFINYKHDCTKKDWAEIFNL
tara:strand:- start:2874 stop:3248 length:375 start_codon:yes stop_codon:yes gene_type:complete